MSGKDAINRTTTIATAMATIAAWVTIIQQGEIQQRHTDWLRRYDAGAVLHQIQSEGRGISQSATRP